MFNCNLYVCKNDKNKVDKQLQVLKTYVNCTYKDETNIIKPTIFLTYTTDCDKVNYIYLSDKKRFYFVTNKKMTNGGKILFELEVDVLTSFKDEIKNMTATVTRNENLKNGYLEDKNYKLLSYENVVCKSFPRGLTNDSLILMTVG